MLRRLRSCDDPKADPKWRKSVMIEHFTQLSMSAKKLLHVPPATI